MRLIGSLVAVLSMSHIYGMQSASYSGSNPKNCLLARFMRLDSNRYLDTKAGAIITTYSNEISAEFNSCVLKKLVADKIIDENIYLSFLSTFDLDAFYTVTKNKGTERVTYQSYEVHRKADLVGKFEVVMPQNIKTYLIALIDVFANYYDKLVHGDDTSLGLHFHKNKPGIFSWGEIGCKEEKPCHAIRFEIGSEEQLLQGVALKEVMYDNHGRPTICHCINPMVRNNFDLMLKIRCDSIKGDILKKSLEIKGRSKSQASFEDKDIRELYGDN